MSATDIGIVLLVCLTVTIIAASCHVLLPGARRPPGSSLALTQAIVLLFDDETLIDASPDGRRLLARGMSGLTEWQRFLGWALPRYPGLMARLENLRMLGRFEQTPANPADAVLHAEWRSGTLRIILIPPHHGGEGMLHDPLTRHLQDEELELLRQTLDDAPLPIWRENDTRQVTWANRSCLSLLLAYRPDKGLNEWPLPPLFDAFLPGRARLAGPADRPPLWFAPHVSPGPDGHTVFAMPIDQAVTAETALHAFRQTLARIFAELPVELAIFDDQRRLQMFNPAFAELSGMQIPFLSLRPTLFTLFDRMRDQHMLPEPRDYHRWRQDMAALEQDADTEGCEQIWSLASGATYRVQGRPHAEGALALLFHDISDEVSTTSRLRADLALGRSALDAAEEAMAIFSSAGHLVLANTAHEQLWGTGHEGRRLITDMVQLWRRRCAPSRIWDQVTGFVTHARPRQGCSLPARMHDGRALRCRLAPLNGGATLVAFSLDPPGPEARPPMPIHRADPAHFGMNTIMSQVEQA